MLILSATHRFTSPSVFLHTVSSVTARGTMERKQLHLWRRVVAVAACKRRAVAVAACLLTLTLPGRAAQAQAGNDTEADDGPARGGVPGGQMVRGTISAVIGDHLTVKSETGQTYEIVTTSNTRIMRQRQQVKLADLKPGDGVGAAGVLDAPTHTLHAAFLFAVSAEDVRKAQENLGKTYITGRVTAIDDLKLIILRPDQVSQTIEVDEGTSFRKGGRGTGGGTFGIGAESSGPPRQSGAGTPPASQSGEIITLADIKVGDSIFAIGALHNGVFHPSELRVGNPRRRRPEGASARPPAAIPPPQ